MNFTTDIVIGLEIHAQLNTKSKLFCSCATQGSDIPNTRTCEICLGHPGSRPMLNKQAVDNAIKLGIALGCTLAPTLIFSRKSYFYPDMSKNFQITQFEEPLGAGGSVMLKSGKDVNLTRIHLEEDPAALSYPGSMKNSVYSYMDYNRAGNPLVEIVTEPVLYSPAEARDFLNRLISILTYLKIFDPTTCIIKADANISLKESKYTRVEIKNITGFKELEKALHYEITRQRALLRQGLAIKRETRGWDGRATTMMRSKETEADYGYIIEPDLSLIDITAEIIAMLKKDIPELAHRKAERFVEEYKLEKDDAEVMAMELELAELFEKLAAAVDPVLAAKWLRRELLRVLNYNKKTIREIAFDEKELIELLALVESRQISETTGQKLMEKLMDNRFSPKKYVEKAGLLQITSHAEIKNICEKISKEQAKAVQDYYAGEEKSFHFLVGQVMRATKGKAEPKLVNQVMKEVLER